MGKEQDLVDYVFNQPKERLDDIRGSPTKVLEILDEFATNVQGLMTVGPEKGAVIIDLLKEKKPRIAIELGGYVGYSAILFSQYLAHEPHAKFYTFEVNEEFANIARKFIELAGVSHKAEIIVGKASETLVTFGEKLKKHSYVAPDFIFIDHWKDLYVPDLRVLESLNLVAPGAIITADNIYHPGVPDYVKYVQSSPEERREHNYNVENVNGKQFIGRWNILYDSKTVEVQTPRHKDAVEVSRVVEYLNG